MKPCEDLTGKRFNMLTVEYRCSYSMCGAMWHCRCDCGGEVDARASHLRNGTRVSCGCMRGHQRQKEGE